VCAFFLQGSESITLKYYSSLSFFARWNIFRFLERGIFSLQLLIFFPEILIREWAIKNSLTISDIEHTFGVLEREFLCEYLMFYKFVDIMSRSWGN